MRYKSYRIISSYSRDSYILLGAYNTERYRPIESIGLTVASHFNEYKDVAILHDGEDEDERNIKIGEDSPWFNYDILVAIRNLNYVNAPHTPTGYLPHMATNNKILKIIPNLIKLK